MPTPELSTLRWRKSSRSNGAGNSNCVEVALLAGRTVIRDSKNPDATALLLPAAAWLKLLELTSAGGVEVA